MLNQNVTRSEKTLIKVWLYGFAFYNFTKATEAE